MDHFIERRGGLQLDQEHEAVSLKSVQNLGRKNIDPGEGYRSNSLRESSGNFPVSESRILLYRSAIQTPTCLLVRFSPSIRPCLVLAKI